MRHANSRDRYAVADDYMSLVYKLWEGSWADNAVVVNRERGVFTRPETRPARVLRVRHEGPHYSLDALHLCEPSPQRTPVLDQAGTSPAGRALASRHAECVFMSGPSSRLRKTPLSATASSRACWKARVTSASMLRASSMST